jgi:site-specific recombinase XerD
MKTKKTTKKTYKASGSKKTSALTLDQFNFILDELRDIGDTRMETLCLLLGKCIRIGDVLKTIRIKDAYTPSGEVRAEITFKEEKTGKDKRIKVGTSKRLVACLEALYPTIRHLAPSSVLFYAKKTGEALQDKGVKKILGGFVGKRGIEQCSPHSFRKFGARYLFDQGYDIEVVSQVLNHSSVRETRTYLDIKPREVEAAMEALAF